MSQNQLQTQQMPTLGLGQPNAPNYPNTKMRPLPVNQSGYEHDVSSIPVRASTAAVNEAYDNKFYEEKKRSAAGAGDKNPGATKKSKADGEGEHISSALPQPRLPNLVLSMKDDTNYRQIMNEAIEKIVGKEFTAEAEKEMGASILQKLQRDYHLLDTNGEPADIGTALQKICLCLHNKRRYKKRKSEQQQSQSSRSLPEMILDMAKDKNYERVMTKAFEKMDGENFDRTGEKVLQELKQSYHLLDRSGESIDDSEALKKLVWCVKNQHYRSRNRSLGSESECYQQPQPRSQSRSQDHSGRVQSQNQEVLPRVQMLTRDKLSEAEAKRVELLEYFGDSIVADYLKNISCGWNFSRQRGLVDDEWIAVKEGFTKANAQEDVTMLTGSRKIANWAYREGHFESYANYAYGRNRFEQRGLSAETYKIIFDRESEERTGIFDQEPEEQNDAASRRTDNPNSSSRVNEDGSSNVTLLLRGEDLDEYIKIYEDIAMKRSPDPESDVNAEEFYGLLQKCLETKMLNTQQWNAKKHFLANSSRRFEDAVNKAAAISQKTGTSWYRDGIIPAIIEEAKEKLLGA